MAAATEFMRITLKNGQTYDVVPQKLTRKTDQRFTTLDGGLNILPRWAIASTVIVKP